MAEPLEQLVAQLRAGEARALARVLSYIEDGGRNAEESIERVFPHTGKAYVIGITGSPGAGKSTLVDQLVHELSVAGRKVGVIAVDPSSPFSGGALLGDRIRMNRAVEHKHVFIRSMASRGALGGLAPRTAEAIFAFDAAGYDYVIVETVGVGQGEVEIVRTSDAVVVVLVPGMGDGVQALKAGILEIADLFVINKADYAGADRLEKELKTMIGLAEKSARKPEVLRTVASEARGTAELIAGLDRFRDWSKGSGSADVRRQLFLRQAFERQLSEQLLRDAMEYVRREGLLEDTLKSLFSREKGPLSCARELQQKYLDAQKQGA